MKKKRICALSLFGGLFFAACTVMGTVYAAAGDTPGTLLTETNRGNIFIAAFLTVVFCFVLRRLLHRDYTVLEDPASGGFFCRHTLLISFGVLLLAWTPYFVICYPGSVSYDACRQFEMLMGVQPLTNKHPVISTLLLGLFFRLGRGVNDNFGIFTVVLAQSALNAAAFALCVRRILKLTGSRRAAAAGLAFFALNPVWPLFQQAIIKDTAFYGFFLLYTLGYLEVADLVLDKTRNDPLELKKAACVALPAVMCSLMRHGELIVIAISLLLLALLALRERKRTLLLLAVTVALGFGSNRAVIAVTHAGSTPVRAAFSVFFQQTALYMKKYPKDVTPEQYEAIDAVLDAETIGELYNPLLTDPVKNTYRENVGKKELAAYFKAWFQMFFRHPRTYLDSFLQFSSGYFDPFHMASRAVKRPFYISSIRGEKVEGVAMTHPAPKSLRRTFVEYTDMVYTTPLVEQLIFPGTYFWVCAVCFLLMWHKRRFRQMAVYSLPFLRVAMCLASPVAGYLRYTLPLLSITPLMIAWACANAAAADKGGNKDPLR